MFEVLKEVGGTSVPNILMGLGGLFLILAFVRRIGTTLELPPERQRSAALTGIVLLLAGIGITVMPHLPVRGSPEQLANFSPDSDKPLGSPTSDGDATGDTSPSNEASEPKFRGQLDALMPDIKLLPTEMRLFSRDARDIEERLAHSDKQQLAARNILTEAKYQGLEVKYDSFCGSSIPLGEVKHAIFQVDWFETPSQAKEYWDLASTDGKPQTHPEDHWPVTHDSWVSESFVNCGSASSILQWRILRVGNVILHVGLFTSDRSPNDPYVTSLSKELIESMARKVPNSKSLSVD